MSAADDPLARIIPLLENVKKNGSGITARCPNHEDRHNSLSIGVGADGRLLLKDHAGCETERVVAAIGWTIADLFVRKNGNGPRRSTPKRNGTRRKGGEGVHTPPNNTATAQRPGLTLEQYAAAKRLDPARLRAMGVDDAPYFSAPAIRITYHDVAGNEASVRYRFHLEKKPDEDDRFKWRRGSKVCLYGVNRLAVARARGYVVLVEGESDSQTLWIHGEPAVGVPGANNWNEARDARMLADIPTIYVVIEPDRGGEAILSWLGASAIRDRVQLVSLDPHKDPSALHCEDPERFAERWQAALAAAEPLSNHVDAAAHEEKERAWEECQDLAQEADILTHASKVVAALGVAGERVAVLLVFLAMVSRLLARPVNVAVKGPSSGGKSFLVEQTLRLFPGEAFYALTAMSERALAYSDEPLSHRTLVLYEAGGSSGDMGSYLLRSLLSERCVRYETVEKTAEGLRARLIEREGPTGLIVTTTKASLHPENETRMVSITVSDTKEQTRAIFEALANGRDPEPDLAPWHALQRWLARGESRATIPFAPALAALVPPKAVRLRRDFELLLTLIRAHALLHRASRECDEDGTIRATLDDYEAVRALVEPLIAAGVEATVPAAMRETVAAVKALCEKPDDTASLAAIARELRLDKSATSRRVSAARERGYLVNRESKRGQPLKIALGEPLPDDAPFLPDRCSVAVLFEGDNTPPPSPEDDDPFATVGEPGDDPWTWAGGAA